MLAEQLLTSVLLNFVTKKVCYPSYGCYSNAPPYNIPFALLPNDPVQLNTTYMVFSRQLKSPESPEVIKTPFYKQLKNIKMIKKKKTIIIAHGFIESTDAYWFKPIVKELLESEDMNVIWVDWAAGAAFPYSQAIGNSRIIATEITMLIKSLLKKQLVTAKTLHLIGFSTGAHMMGRVGYLLKEKGITVNRISGLDPAGPPFKGADPMIRLDASDAEFVDAIHTDAENPILGTTEQEGQVDFYPNGAGLQPGCKRVTTDIFSMKKLQHYVCCSHFRAIDYFIESINNKQSFSSVQCDNYKRFLSGSCTKCYINKTTATRTNCNRMGYHTSRQAKGKFYLLTQSKKPFSAHQYAVMLHTGTKTYADFYGSVKLQVVGQNGKSEEIQSPGSYHSSGSRTPHFFVTTKPLGRLLRLDVTAKTSTWYSDDWYLEKVAVASFNGEKYEACVKKWIKEKTIKLKLSKTSKNVSNSKC